MNAFSDSTKRVSRGVWRYIVHYVYGMFARSFNCSITAVDAVIGLSVGAAASTDVTKPNWQAAAAIFGVTYIRSCLMWLKDHPIPEKLSETQPPFPVV